MYKQVMLIILSFSLIFLLLLPGCQPSTIPDLTIGTISGQVALPGSSFKDITGYTPIPGATVTIIDAEGNTHTTLTDSNGFYSFDNIRVKANTIINIEKDTAGGGKIVFREVIPQALSPEENFYAGIADAESTALALVIEALINLGQLQEEIDLEEIISAPGFAQLEEDIRQAQSSNQDILTLSSIITQAQAIADYLVNPPSPTPAPTPVPSSAKKITAYKFEASNNPALPSDVVGTIDSVNHTVSLTIPSDTAVTSLIATFTLSKGATAQVGTTPQVSGTTHNDFTSSVTYTVTAEDNSTQDWTITVSKTQPVRYVATDGDNNDDGSESAPWKTIQYALTIIPTSGTILVKEGTYNESITFPSDKVITLKSTNSDSSTTIIVGDDVYPTVYCDNSLAGTTLEGFTISHESGNSGRGITTIGYLTISNCTISYNSADIGGGIINYGVLTIISSAICHNFAGYGSGICNSGTLALTGSDISYNSADDGGGIYNNIDGTLTISGSTISWNSAADDGGGIYNYDGTLTISNNSGISYNSAYNSGGIANRFGTATIIESTISHNSANVGGGIGNSGILTITSSTISYNSADYNGGGIANYGTLTISNGIITDNSSDYGGGGIYNSQGSEARPATITGSTISTNFVSSSGNGGGIYLVGVGPIVIGGNSNTDLDNFNNFINNYKEGSAFSADQHIRNTSGNCHWDYLNNYYSPAEVTSYKFEDINNDALSADVEGDINPTDRTISLTVPSGTDVTGLVATFTLVTGASAKVGTTSQESGSTPNDFNSPVIYAVFKTTEPSKITNWTVTVTISP